MNQDSYRAALDYLKSIPVDEMVPEKPEKPVNKFTASLEMGEFSFASDLMAFNGEGSSFVSAEEVLNEPGVDAHPVLLSLMNQSMFEEGVFIDAMTLPTDGTVNPRVCFACLREENDEGEVKIYRNITAISRIFGKPASQVKEMMSLGTYECVTAMRGILEEKVSGA